MFPLDLADLPSVASFAAAVRQRVTGNKGSGAAAANGVGIDGTTAVAGGNSGAGGAGVDLLVLCAGIAGKPYKASPQVRGSWRRRREGRRKGEEGLWGGRVLLKGAFWYTKQVPPYGTLFLIFGMSQNVGFVRLQLRCVW